MEACTTANLLSVDKEITYLIIAQDNSDDAAESGATCVGGSSAHPTIGIKGNLATIRALIAMLGEHLDLESCLMGDMLTLQQLYASI